MAAPAPAENLSFWIVAASSIITGVCIIARSPALTGRRRIGSMAPHSPAAPQDLFTSFDCYPVARYTRSVVPGPRVVPMFEPITSSQWRPPPSAIVAPCPHCGSVSVVKFDPRVDFKTSDRPAKRKASEPKPGGAFGAGALLLGIFAASLAAGSLLWGFLARRRSVNGNTCLPARNPR